MKKNVKLFTVLLVVVLVTSAGIFYACQKIDENTNPLKVTKNPYEYLGKMNNDFLTNFKDNFKFDAAITKLGDGIDLVKEFNVSYVLNSNLNQEEKEIYVNSFDEFKRFVNAPEFYSEFFSPNSKNSDGEYFDFVKEVYSIGRIDDFEFEQLNLIGKVLIENYEGIISDYELEKIILKIQDDWSAQGYSVNSDKGHILAMTLAISISSIEWWKENPDVIELTKAVPVVVANDVAGAAIGAVVAGVNSYVNTGEVSWGGVAGGAVAGAVTGSTGVVGKIGKWISNLF